MSEDRRKKILAQPSAMKEVYDEDTVNPHVIVRGPDGWHLFYGPYPGPHNDAVYHATSDDLIVWTRQEPVLRRGASGDCDAQEIADCSNRRARGALVHALPVHSQARGQQAVRPGGLRRPVALGEGAGRRLAHIHSRPGVVGLDRGGSDRVQGPLRIPARGTVPSLLQRREHAGRLMHRAGRVVRHAPLGGPRSPDNRRPGYRTPCRVLRDSSVRGSSSMAAGTTCS